uniref:ANK_REP_REGION domain-containing protein n=1 Tax=Rodentolepis nana TaxID=102285 RepID=A0A0R3TA16_RODNA
LPTLPALHVACWRGSSKTLKILLKAGAKVHYKDGRFQTALHVAVFCGFSKGIKVLLQSGCPADLENHLGYTPLLYATILNFSSIARFIVEYDIASVYHVNEHEFSPLLMALETRHLDLAMFYIKAGGSLLDRSYELNMAVYLALNNGYVEVMEALLVHGANAVSKYKLHYAVKPDTPKRPNYVENVALLASWCVDPTIFIDNSSVGSDNPPQLQEEEIRVIEAADKSTDGPLKVLAINRQVQPVYFKNLNATRIAKQFTNSLESPNKQPLVVAFKNIIDEALRPCCDNWNENFYQARTDFQRVCILLQSIESSVSGRKQGVNKLGLDVIEEEVIQVNGKSDEVSRRYLSYGKLAMLEENLETGLNVLTKAVFYASSSKQLSEALAQRCQLLHEIQLFDEAIEDGLMALKPPSVNEVEEKMSINDSESSGASEFDRRNVVNSKLLSAPNGIVRLKDTGCAKTGFAMEVTRNVSAGQPLESTNTTFFL